MKDIMQWFLVLLLGLFLILGPTALIFSVWSDSEFPPKIAATCGILIGSVIGFVALTNWALATLETFKVIEKIEDKKH